MRSFNSMRLCAVLSVAMTWPAPARGTDFHWISPVGGNFRSAAFWAPFVPFSISGPGGIADSVSFNLGAAPASPYTVTGVQGQNLRLTVRNDAVRMALSADYTLQSPDPEAPGLMIGAAFRDVGRLILSAAGGPLPHQVTTPIMSIADALGSTSEITVAEGVRLSVSSLLMVRSGGGATSATLNVAGVGAEVIHTGANVLRIGNNANVGGSAVINVRDGGKFTTSAGLASSVIIETTGKINLEAGGVFHARRPVHMNGGQFNVTGGTLHVEEFNGNLLNQGGTLAPGQPTGSRIGVTTINGQYGQQPAGTLKIEISGLLPDQRDRVLVTGNALLAGTIDISLLNGFAPALGNSFTILETNVGNVDGQFQSLLAPVVNDRTFDVTYHPKSVVLTVVEASATLPGDFDGNGVVDGADLLCWQRGQSPSPLSAADLAAWKSHFSQSLAEAAGASVPEPAGFVLATGLLALFAPTRHRQFFHNSQIPRRGLPT